MTTARPVSSFGEVDHAIGLCGIQKSPSGWRHTQLEENSWPLSSGRTTRMAHMGALCSIYRWTRWQKTA